MNILTYICSWFNWVPYAQCIQKKQDGSSVLTYTQSPFGHDSWQCIMHSYDCIQLCQYNSNHCWSRSIDSIMMNNQKKTVLIPLIKGALHSPCIAVLERSNHWQREKSKLCVLKVMFHTHSALQIENMVCTTTKCNYFFFFTWCSGAACFCAVALSKTYQKGKQEIRLLQPACSEHIAHLFTHKYKPVHNVSAQNLKQLPKLWTNKCHSTDDWCRCLSSIATRPWIAKPLNVSILPIIARRWCQLHRVPSMWFHFTANEPSVTNSIHIEPVISQLKMISWW